MTAESRNFKGDFYYIRVKGILNIRWRDYFGSFVMVSQDNGETLLSGTVVDQAELHGVLRKICDLGLPLLLVAKNDCPCPENCCHKPDRC